LFASRARGSLMGNRGGRLHDEKQALGSRRWASRQWICCKLDFKGRQRKVWGSSYTELFFLDEVTALAAGHRPCFECRRQDAENFAALFSSENKRATAAAMDETLHTERLEGKVKRKHKCSVDYLPDGAMTAIGAEAFAVRGQYLLRWTPQGYAGSQRRLRGTTVYVLTPPSIVAVLKAGYHPLWHSSAQ
jgi:hypothetical protein